MRTARLKLLVEEVLDSLPQPHTEDVIDDVFQAIEKDPGWRKRYDQEVAQLGKTTTNTWGGFWIAHAEERLGVHQVPSKSSLLGSYSKLTEVGTKPNKRLKEAEALLAMSDYYYKNKDKLPAKVSEHRDFIVELLMEGYSVDEAFSKVLSISG